MKPRVMSLVIFTCVVGLLIAPIQVDFFTAMFSLIAVALGAGAAGTLNMWYESDIDALMQRTCLRPIPSGKISRNQALIFGVLTSFASVIILYAFSNFLSALLLSITILFYVIIYTIWLKQRTSQNIVIGGAAGALPPVIGWFAAFGEFSVFPLVLFLIIFLWTPPHFWALCLYRSDDYKRANVPMLTVVAGKKKTRLYIFLYSLSLGIIFINKFFKSYINIISTFYTTKMLSFFDLHKFTIFNYFI